MQQLDAFRRGYWGGASRRGGRTGGRREDLIGWLRSMTSGLTSERARPLGRSVRRCVMLPWRWSAARIAARWPQVRASETSVGDLGGAAVVACPFTTR